MGPVGVPEMIAIFLVALILFGPKKLPELGRTIGKALTEFRRAQSELKATLEHHMTELERENESLKEVTRGVSNEIYSSYNSPSSEAYYGHSIEAGSSDSSVESNPPTTSASAPEGAESATTHETVAGTVPRESEAVSPEPGPVRG